MSGLTMSHPFKMEPRVAAYLGLIIAVIAFGFAVAALSVAIVLGVR